MAWKCSSHRILQPACAWGKVCRASWRIPFGVVTDPTSPRTRAIAFQCSTDLPALFKDQVTVNIRSKESVAQFAIQFLTDEAFFPSQRRAIATALRPNDSLVAEAGANLYERLQKEWPAWPFVRLRLSLEAAKRIDEAKKGKRDKLIGEIIERINADEVKISCAKPGYRHSVSSAVRRRAAGGRWKPSAGCKNPSSADAGACCGVVRYRG